MFDRCYLVYMIAKAAPEEPYTSASNNILIMRVIGYRRSEHPDSFTFEVPRSALVYYEESGTPRQPG